MPIYEYRCANCGKITEKISNTKVINIDCPDCGARAEKIVSVFSGQTHSTTGAGHSCQAGSGFT